jgi:hypothetical protein
MDGAAMACRSESQIVATSAWCFSGILMLSDYAGAEAKSKQLAESRHTEIAQYHPSLLDNFNLGRKRSWPLNHKSPGPTNV